MAYNELISLGGNGIIDILTDDATATASQILSGYTAYVKGKKVTGNIASQGAQTITPGTSDKTISSGKYLSGTQTIKGDSNLVAGNIKAGTSIFGVTGTYTSDATVGSGDIIVGKHAYANGRRIDGAMPNRATGVPNPIDAIRLRDNQFFDVAVPAGYHGYSWARGQYSYMSFDQVRNAIGLTADKIASGQQILGIWGSYIGRGGERAMLFVENRGSWFNAPGFCWQWNGSGFTCLSDGTYRFNAHAVVNGGLSDKNYFKIFINGGIHQQLQTSFYHASTQFDLYCSFGSTTTIVVDGDRPDYAAILEIVQL